jgi:hypothetical protein
MVDIFLNIHRGIWIKRNEHLHGKRAQEARTKAREAVICQVADLYQKKPKLATRYQPTASITFEQCIRRTTSQLKVWLAHAHHQIQITTLLNTTKQPGQLTLQEAIQNMQRAKEAVMYPP